MLFTKTKKATAETILNKFLVQELISFERFCRDNHLWSEMEKCYHTDSFVDISWYQGSGKGFVRESKKMEMAAPHKLNNILVWINDDKAVAVCMTSIMARKKIDGHLYDLISYVRLYYRLIKVKSEWYISSLESIYEKDSLLPAHPNISKDVLHDYKIDDYRESYANLTYILQLNGYDINDSLAGDDRPKLVEAIHKKHDDWLKN